MMPQQAAKVPGQTPIQIVDPGEPYDLATDFDAAVAKDSQLAGHRAG